MREDHKRNQTLASVKVLWLIVAASSVLLTGIATESNSATPTDPRPQSGAVSRTEPLSDPNFFPIGVWLQEPANAQRYRDAGFNTYVGLWKGPTGEQLSQLKKAGMRVVCEQNQVGRQHLADPTILGWMHGDEPDNAQPLPDNRGYGPPIPPEKVVEDYRRMKAIDPSRPVLLNLGQGVAWDGWPGRGTRSGHPEDYSEYVKGCDVASFDIYPANQDRPAVAGKLWYVGFGVERLVGWSEGRTIWNCIECTHIGAEGHKPTPEEVRCEVWMSLVHGSRGLIYFVHQFQPSFREAALLDDAVMLKAVGDINRQITELAPVLNSPSVPAAITSNSSNPDVPVKVMVKKRGGVWFVFCVPMRAGRAEVNFKCRGMEGTHTVEVIGENRRLTARDGEFKDTFGVWEAHIYRVE